MPISQTRVRKVVAGPGAGKTSGLVDEVLSHLHSLKPNKYFAVITYTNAATEKIRQQLSRRVKIPPNLFIGTIHSFLDKFILIPHASNLGIIPQELTFIDDLEVADVRYKNAVVKKARDKGIITYEQIEWISEKIICGGNIKVANTDINLTAKITDNHAKVISKRLQCLFVDEYQDATISQHNIFVKLISTGFMEHFYCVGDPEQYIYGFTYRGKSKKPKFQEIPIHSIESIQSVEVIHSDKNHRSNSKIIRFINNFSILKQSMPSRVEADSPRVFFITHSDLAQIIVTFNALCVQYQLTNVEKYFLSYAGNTINYQGLTDIEQTVNPSLGSEKLLSEVLRLICAVSGHSQKEICKMKNWDEIDIRRMALKTLKKIKSFGGSFSEENIRNFLQNDFGINSKSDRELKKIHANSFNRILSALNHLTQKPTNIRSTIHKSKGLEAHAVLVIAASKRELKQWLETDHQKRSEDGADTCRIGFVAFSRARELLCIACLENTGRSIQNKISALGASMLL